MNHKLLATLVTAALLLPAQSLMADDEISDSAKYRSLVMSTIGSSFGGFVNVFLGKVDLQEPQTHLVANSQALADSAALVKDLVQAGSEGGDALPAIWLEMDTYQEYAKNLKDATANLAAAAEANDRAAMGAAFKAVGKSCKACHNKFRAEN
ncbi:MAG: cytochrome c [Gammaproteobacteria bacterium]|jgi:cytochrome c556|nr:cytochrome c [Gammaproteobacteria bacterium]